MEPCFDIEVDCRRGQERRQWRDGVAKCHDDGRDIGNCDGVEVDQDPEVEETNNEKGKDCHLRMLNKRA